jgi:hypothetical protein
MGRQVAAITELWVWLDCFHAWVFGSGLLLSSGHYNKR